MLATIAPSPLPTPPEKVPERMGDHRFKYSHAPTEFPKRYRPGGYHPIDIGDLMHDGRYQILKKLGYGSFSTVWLARDTALSKLVAVKVKCAKDSSENSNEIAVLTQLGKRIRSNLPSVGSERVVSLLETFQVAGPNGTHLCLVFEVMGPTLFDIEYDKAEAEFGTTLSIPMVKKVFRQVLLGIQYIHDAGFIHGDIQPANILFCLKNPKEISDDYAMARDPKPCGDPLVRLDGEIDLWAPHFLVSPEPLSGYCDLESDFNVKISDFGTVFIASEILDPEKKEPVTPIALRAPELVLHQAFGPSIDVWSVGCLLFECLTGEPLFCVYLIGDNHDGCDDNHLVQMPDILGPLPRHFFGRWPRWQKYFRSDGTMYNNIIGPGGPYIVDFPPFEVSFRNAYMARQGSTDDEEMYLIIDLIRSIYSTTRPKDLLLRRSFSILGLQRNNRTKRDYE